MIKVFLDDLPRWNSGENKGKIDWKNSIGHKVKFIYYEIDGEIEIVDCINEYLFIKVVHFLKKKKLIDLKKNWLKIMKLVIT